MTGRSKGQTIAIFHALILLVRRCEWFFYFRCRVCVFGCICVDFFLLPLPILLFHSFVFAFFLLFFVCFLLCPLLILLPPFLPFLLFHFFSFIFFFFSFLSWCMVITMIDPLFYYYYDGYFHGAAAAATAAAATLYLLSSSIA